MESERQHRREIIDLTSDVDSRRKRDHRQTRVTQAQEQSSPTHSHDIPIYTHSWKAHERLILKSLREQYENNWSDLALIFNTIFSSNLPAMGLTRHVVRTQYASFTNDPRYRISTQELWKQAMRSLNPTFRSEEEGEILINRAATKLGVALDKKKAQSATPPLQVGTKRSPADISLYGNDRPITKAFENPVEDISTPPPRKRWCGLNATSCNIQASQSGLKTPPSSGRVGRYTNDPGLRTSQSPLGDAQQDHPTSLPYLSLSIAKTETASSYAPSRISVTESYEEPPHTPHLSTPRPDTEPDAFSPCSTTSFTEIGDGEVDADAGGDTGGDAVGDENEDGDNDALQEHSTPVVSKLVSKPIKSVAPKQDDDRPPLLGYRAFSNFSHGFNSNERFVAGLYKDTPAIPPCPSTDSIFYIAEAEKHVRKASEPSPFVSISSTPLRALMLAFGFHRRKSCTGAYLAIIDLKVLRELKIIQRAKDLELKPGITYHPANEYLVWGGIEKGAIISVIHVGDLLGSPPYHPYDDDPLAIKEIAKHWSVRFVWILISQVNRDNQVFLSCFTGYAVGQFVRMLGLPEQFVDSAVDDIVQNWGLACSRHESWRENSIFCEFMLKGYHGVEINRSSINTSSEMTISVEEEVIEFSASRSPIRISSDDEKEEESSLSVVTKDPQMGTVFQQVSADVMDIDNEDHSNCSHYTQEMFATLPAAYEVEKEIDDTNERHYLADQGDRMLRTLPRAYEAEMAHQE